MTDAPRTVAERLDYARNQIVHPSQDWTGMCQKFCRKAAGVPALFGSAWAQWLGADDEDKHPGGSPSAAPVGSYLLFKGSGKYGHIELAAHPFPNDTPGAFSNDLVKYGDIDKVARNAPMTAWGQGYLGYITAINDYDLLFPVPKPKQDKPYGAIAKAIEQLGRARDTARAQKDARDVEILTKEIERLKVKYARLRRY